MKSDFNKFAFIKVKCDDCGQFILFEPYRRVKFYYTYWDVDVETTCRDCYNKKKQLNSKQIKEEHND